MDPITSALVNEFATSQGIEDYADDKKFEHFAGYSIVSNRYDDEFDTADIVVGDGQDLNVDAFAVKVNGRLATDPQFIDDVVNLNGYLEVEFIIIQAKTSSSFDGAALIALGDNLANEVFAQSQSMPVNAEVKRLIEIKDKIFSHAGRLRENPTCRVFYACTGTWRDDDYLVAAISRKTQDLLDTNLFSSVQFTPLGAREIQELYRATRTSISREITFSSLVTLPNINNVEASYLGVLPHTEFLKLVSDSDGEIVKSVFVDNVRDFQGQNPVNADIATTITDGLLDQFVLRNNGITIVARDIRVTSNKFTLVDYQIVNGCQTSHVIFANKDAITDELFVPLKLIHTQDEDVSQAVIKSTNKQTKVEENDLLALTNFQRGLEDFYNGQPNDIRLFYERRAKQYATRGDIEKGRITSIGNQLKCFASMFLELPNQASRYQGTLMKTVNDQVFQQNHRPEAYFLAALAQYRFEVAIRRLPQEERDIRPFRYYLLLAFRHRFETVDFPGAGNRRIEDYCSPLADRLLTHELAKVAFDECVEIVREAVTQAGLPFERDSAKSRPLIEAVKAVAIQRKSAEAP